MESETTWLYEDRQDILPIVCEAIGAAWLSAHVADDTSAAFWHGGNKPLIDIEHGGYRVDAKRAFIQPTNWLGKTGTPCVGFMGGGRTPEARDGVSHYLLVVPSELPVVAIRGPKINFEYDGSEADLYLVPAVAVNEYFRPAHTARGVGAGRNLYVPTTMAEGWRVRF